ncbi:Asp-tRNA(Asn)/Glu-tRNA(Gln) amidotransferase subunit GatA [Methanonatronarchaeum sp. AMET6-2]|nr:Asp-tRNA(Asn)/Glu-tRNA(Gln) amidotransferase subunit GatA [Methanonatronarchaeum sp. AMET6-2]RZN60868.1 MAG: Asp-tRNA(Asn)/Glu-tRNA(Gln) amidotransferase subunit GatA [Methanonatronarchaeia archaeon]UOY09566.1 Asp-tRNA(Asn)/Glu-tRNA(Gln) amidotransferase subunit GatA [Methanonatronarchaeum sp. AMET6-2]
MIEVWKASKDVREGNREAVDILEDVVKEIEGQEEDINAYITLEIEEAFEKAREVDQQVSRGEDPGLLAGVPIGIKDSISTREIPTTCGSKSLENYVPPYNATVINKIKDEGGVITGKTNCDEFCMGSTTETSYYGPTKNPLNTELVPGGSSGGSAAAVKYGGALAALGSDTGGSVRCPAAFCSVVGLKPTYGQVSRYGLIAYASSLDQIGPITTSVRDAALMLDVISGEDPQDSTSSSQNQNHHENLTPKTDATLGIPSRLHGEGVDQEVKKEVDRVIDKARDMGAETKEVNIPSLEYALPAYCIISMSEASSNLARYDGVRYGYTAETNEDWDTEFKETRGRAFGKEVKRRIILGTYALSAGYYDKYYNKAMKIRRLLHREFNEALTEVDALIAPSMPYKPFKIGEKIDDPLSLYMGDALNVPVNMVGAPSITLPTDKETPVGIQVIGGHHQEQEILDIALAMEENK